MGRSSAPRREKSTLRLKPYLKRTNSSRVFGVACFVPLPHAAGICCALILILVRIIRRSWTNQSKGHINIHRLECRGQRGAAGGLKGRSDSVGTIYD
ncbi:hypothetical protein L596_007243 [Steinernema carpocapsae]|uniref:Uncharacterized protein n=1 Tax=Steinernema carpocapsae TaxID=34508 RepID=A0A4V6A5X4_STECR|nr:hypothetical protein L596_007243 [Steinernema carpocapsae]